MAQKWIEKAPLALAPAFLAAALGGCGSDADMAVEVEKHMTRAQAECPARTGETFDAGRHRMALESAYQTAHLKRLNDGNVTVCLSRALADAKPVPPATHPVFAIYHPPADGKGALLQLWDDGNPPEKIRPVMNQDSFIRHPASAFRGVAGILDHDSKFLKPEEVNIAIGDAGCGYSCTDITWYPADKQQELLKLNPQLNLLH